MINKCELVRKTCQKVVDSAQNVKIDEGNLKKFCEEIKSNE